MTRGSISKSVDSRGNVRWRVRFDLPPDDGRRRHRQITVATRHEAELLLTCVQTAHVAFAGKATAASVDRWLREQSSGR